MTHEEENAFRAGAGFGFASAKFGQTYEQMTEFADRAIQAGMFDSQLLNVVNPKAKTQ